MVDLTRDEHGNLHARLLDVVQGRSGTVYAGWLTAQGEEFTGAYDEHRAHRVTLDPRRQRAPR